MRFRFSLPLIIALALVTVLTSCKKDDDVKRSVYSPIIDASGYTAGGTPAMMYSTDNGATFTSTFPKVEENSVVMIKVNNGTRDLTKDDFHFDWSASSFDPEDVNADIAVFHMTKYDLYPTVDVDDIQVLVTSNVTTGVFQAVDTATAAKTDLFSLSSGGTTVTGIRSLVFHNKKQKLYASTVGDVDGVLYEIDLTTKTPTVINSNVAGVDSEWFGISSLVVLPDDSLMGIGFLNDVNQNALMKFGTDGAKSPWAYTVDFCCSLGMIYDRTENELIISDDPAPGAMKLVRTEVDGEVIDTRTTYNLVGFPVTMTNVYAPTKSLTKSADGKYYAIMNNTVENASYLVRIDVAGLKVIYLGTLGAGDNNLYNMLQIIPKHAL